MTRALAVAVVLGLLTGWAGCASENGFRPYDGDDVGDGDGDGDGGGDGDGDGGDAGGWGDWDLGDVPDLALVLAVLDPATSSTELVVTDLRGQVLDRWTPPVDPELGYAMPIQRIHPLGEGEVLVTTTHSLWDKTTQDEQYLQWAYSGLAEVWHADLVERRWTRLVHLDWGTARYVVDATGDPLHADLVQAYRGVRAVPWGVRGDGVLLDFDDGACGRDGGHSVLGLDAIGTAHRLWPVDRTLPEPTGTPFALLTGGVDGSGAPVAFARRGGGPCEGTAGSEPELVRWTLDGRAHTLAVDLEPSDQVAAHPYSGSAVVVHAPPVADAPWHLEWLGAPDAVDSAIPHLGPVRPLAVLDPAHSAAVVALQDPSTTTDEIVLTAAGRDVWRIEGLASGLGPREPFRLHTGTVVAIPGD